MLAADILVVLDATTDSRFAADPLVTGDVAVRFCAAVPLVGPDDARLGTVCVLDRRARAEGPSAAQQQQLRDLAALAVDHLELRRTRAALEASRRHVELTSMATRASVDAILITLADPIDPPDGPEVVYCNEAFTRLTGYAPEDIVGKTPRVLQGPETDREALARIRRHMAALLPVRQEVRNYTKEGVPFWTELNIVPVADAAGRYTHIVSVQRDTTERHAQLAALQESEQRYRLLFHANPQSMWVYDCETFAFLDVNAAAEAMYGYSRDEFLSRTVLDIRPPRSGNTCARQRRECRRALPAAALAPPPERWPPPLRADLVVSGHVRGSSRAAGARARHHRREGTRRTTGAGPEDGGRGPVGRRCRPRLQQSPHGDQRLRAVADGAAARGRSAAGRCGTHPAGRRAGGLAHATVAGVQPPAGAAAAAARRRGSHRPPPSDDRSPPAGGHRGPHDPAVVAAASDGGPRAARTGAAQPRDQRLGRHARRRHAVAGGRTGRRGRRDGRATGHARRPLRHPVDVGHRRGHDRGDPRAHLRAVLHDQGQGSRVRPRPASGLRHRQAERRHHRRAHDPGRGVDVHRVPAHGRRARGRGRSGGSDRCHAVERARDGADRGRPRGRASPCGRRAARPRLPGARRRARPRGHRAGRGLWRQGRPGAHRRDHAAHERTRGRDGAAAARPRYRRPLHERLHADRDRAERFARIGTAFPRQALHAGRTAGARPRGAGGTNRGSRRRQA